MPLTDLTLDELRDYRSSVTAPADFDAFWARTLAESRDAATGAAVRAVAVDTRLRLVDTYDVTFPGYAGEPVRAWWRVPAGTTAAGGRLPTVVRYRGYGGGRGLAHEVPFWVLAGYGCLDIDTRGQGSTWLAGDTPDPHGSGPAAPGHLTRGIDDPATYYYRRVFTDAVLAIDALPGLVGADPGRVAVTGVSQGGGVTLAVAGLRGDIAAALPDVPFLCDIRRGTEIAGEPPYTEVAAYLAVHRDRVERVFATLAYFDGVSFAARAGAPALFSAALMDRICPPSTVFGAFHAYAGPKDVRVYPYNDHEGGQDFHEAVQLEWLSALLPAG